MERLILFARSPKLHEVKTRLLPRLTAEQALSLHEAMLRDQIDFLAALSGASRTSEVCLDDRQGAGDLGERMHRALGRAFDEGAERAAIVGSDAPTLPRFLIEEAFARLGAGADAVIVLAEDGGYVLVGGSHSVPELFRDVPWGTREVANTTRRLAREAGLVLAETAPWFDVDVEGDLARLARELAEDSSRAPATASVLRRLGLYARWPQACW